MAVRGGGVDALDSRMYWWLGKRCFIATTLDKVL